MKLIRDKKIVEDEKTAGVISVSCHDNYFLIQSKNPKHVIRQIKHQIRKGDFQCPYFCEQYQLGHMAKIEVVRKCKHEDLKAELYKTKLNYIERGLRLMNEDIIQVHDTIVPFRYMPAVRKIIHKLENHELRYDMLESLTKIKL